MYMTHLSKNFANDWSNRRLFAAGAKEKRTEERKEFLQELEYEFSEDKTVQAQHEMVVPKLQFFAKRVKNLAVLKNSMDKKYVKGKQELLRKKQLMEDASAMDAKFIDYEVTLKNFCTNMQQFIALSKSKKNSAEKLQQISGFNSFIRSIAFDELTGLLRTDFSHANISYIAGFLANFHDSQKRKVSTLFLGNGTRSNRTVMMSQAQQSQITNMDLVKKLYYFNRSLEEHNNDKINQNKNLEVLQVKAEAKLIEEKLYERVLSNGNFATFNRTDVFKELRKGTLYPNGNPIYSTAIPITQSIEKSEKAAGKFEHILHRNRYQSNCLDSFAERLKRF